MVGDEGEGDARDDLVDIVVVVVVDGRKRVERGRRRCGAMRPPPAPNCHPFLTVSCQDAFPNLLQSSHTALEWRGFAEKSLMGYVVEFCEQSSCWYIRLVLPGRPRPYLQRPRLIRLRLRKELVEGGKETSAELRRGRMRRNLNWGCP